MVRRSSLAMAILLAVAACSSDSSSIDNGSASTAGSQLVTTADRDSDATDQASSGNGEARTIELTVANPPMYDSGSGVTLTIDDARVGDLTSLPKDVAEEMAFGLEDPNSQSFLILTITVQNLSEAPVAFYPDQGTALVGSDQIDANFIFPESFTGATGAILDSASVTEDVYFELSQSADDVADLGKARYAVSGPFDDETFETVGPDVDLTIVWTR